MLVSKIASEYKPPGSEPVSLSDERAIKAQEWVEKEVDKLMKNIMALAKKNQSTGRFEVTFGELFYTYQDISDTLVGIMVRAKKRGFIEYEGQGGHMLFQGRHDNVVVTVTSAGEAAASGKAVSSPAPSSTPPPKAATTPQSLPPKPAIDATRTPPSSTSSATQSAQKSQSVSSSSTSSAMATPVSSLIGMVKNLTTSTTPSESKSPSIQSLETASASQQKPTSTANSASISSSTTTTGSDKSKQAPLGSLAAKWAADPSTGAKDTMNVAPKPVVAALPQRTQGGTRGAIIYSKPAASSSTSSSMAVNASSSSSTTTVTKKADHSAWTQKHLKRMNSNESGKPKEAFSVSKMASALDSKITSTTTPPKPQQTKSFGSSSSGAFKKT